MTLHAVFVFTAFVLGMVACVEAGLRPGKYSASKYNTKYRRHQNKRPSLKKTR